jgi:hypothetical protein
VEGARLPDERRRGRVKHGEVTARHRARRSASRRAGRRATVFVAVLGVLVVLSLLAPGGTSRALGDESTDDQPTEVEVEDRTALGLGGAAVFDPASPSFELAVQRFVGPRVALGVRQEGGFVTGGRGWHLATSVAADVHPLDDPKPLVSPFVGVAGGALYGGGAAGGTVGPEAGVALFLSDAWLLEARYQFRWASEYVGGLDREQHLAWLGVRVLLPVDDGGDLARAEESAARAEEAATKAEEAVARLEAAVGRLERAVDAYAAWFAEQLRK